MVTINNNPAGQSPVLAVAKIEFSGNVLSIDIPTKDRSIFDLGPYLAGLALANSATEVSISVGGEAWANFPVRLVLGWLESGHPV